MNAGGRIEVSKFESCDLLIMHRNRIIVVAGCTRARFWRSMNPDRWCDKHRCGFDHSRTEGAHVAADKITDTSSSLRLHFIPGPVPVLRETGDPITRDPLTLEKVRRRLLALQSHLKNQRNALTALRGALSAEDSVARDVASVLDQYVLYEDITEDLESLIAEIEHRAAMI